MERDDALAEELRRLANLIDSDGMALIDFDKLRLSLQHAAARLTETAHVSEQLMQLRGDYEGRIAGMLKAVAAVERNRSRQEDAAVEAQALSNKTVTELLACYRRAAARFRDSFPSSFGLLQAGDKDRAPSKSSVMMDFK